MEMVMQLGRQPAGSYFGVKFGAAAGAEVGFGVGAALEV